MIATRSSRTRQRARELPIWPLWGLFAGFPIAWLLGLGGFIPQIVAVPMVFILATVGSVRLPKSLGTWLLFLLWMLLSALEVSGATHFLGFAYRASLYVAATVIFVYVYNCAPERLPVERLCTMAAIMLGFVVVGGYLGIAHPHGSLTTPFQHVLPGSIVNNDLVGKLVHPPFAQVSTQTAARVKPRPAAPFPYTNTWGVNFAFLVPFVLAGVASARRSRVRVALITLLIVGLVPAVATLNRGMAFGIAVGVVYVAVRFAMQGHGRALVGVLVVAGLLVGIGSALHVTRRLDERLSNSSSNDSRTAEYAATYNEVRQSPLLGYGAPAASTVNTNGPDLGTQGEFWTVLYSSGFPGAAFYVLALIGFAWSTRRVRSQSMMWMHAVPIIALAVLIVYRIQGTELDLLMAATAIALRDRPVRWVLADRAVQPAREFASISG
ncbi:MAG TPA: O-antigen ligase family protein [Mycobacteriales bacterium]|nr:O-antigen ligase family protein [Mycobacteriales bacterium]